jgi:hypothetical protein
MPIWLWYIAIAACVWLLATAVAAYFERSSSGYSRSAGDGELIVLASVFWPIVLSMLFLAVLVGLPLWAVNRLGDATDRLIYGKGRKGQ